MNHLKHILGKPVCQPNGLTLRGSALARSAGTSGNHSKRSAKILVATRDSDDSTEIKLSSRSYAKLIRDYSNAIDVRKPVTKINAESKLSRNRGFFSKSPFQRLTRVSSLVHVKSSGNNCGPSLCTKSSTRPLQDSFKRHEKITNKSKASSDDYDAHNDASKRAEWLDHVVRAHNAKRAAKNVSSSDNFAQGNNLAHHLVQKLPESRATRKSKDVNDTPISFVKNPWGSSASDTSKLSQVESKLSKSISDASLRLTSSLKKVPDASASDAKIEPRKSSATSKVIPKVVVNEGRRSSAKKFTKTSATDVKNMTKSSTSGKKISKSISDSSLRSSFINKSLDVSASNLRITAKKSSARQKVNSKTADEGHRSHAKKASRISATDLKNSVKQSTPGKNISKSTSNTNVRSSILKRLSGSPPGYGKVVANKSNLIKKSSQKSFTDPRESYYAPRKKISDTSVSGTNSVSVVVERLRTVDNAQRDLLTRHIEDSDAMLVTVTENSNSSSNLSPLRHVDFRINGKPATGAATLISKADKLNVVSSADKIEITIPVPSKFEQDMNDNLNVTKSTINLCVSDSTGRMESYMTGRTRSGLLRPPALTASNTSTCRKPKSNHLAKVVPWWTTPESFRRSEASSARSSRTVTINKDVTMKTLGVGKWSAGSNQEARERTAKEVVVSDAAKVVKFVVTKPSSSRLQQQQHHQSKNKRSSIVTKIIGSESPKKSERDGKERQADERVTPGILKPEAKTDTKVSGIAPKVPKPDPPVLIATTMPRKSAPASTPTPDQLSKKMTASLGSTVTASGGKSITDVLKPKNSLDSNRNNNLSEADSSRGKARVEATPKAVKGVVPARREGATTSVDRGSKGTAFGGKTESSSTAIKRRQDVISKSKSETKSGTQLPRTYGKIKTLPSSQYRQKVVNRANDNQRVPVKSNEGTASTGDKVVGLKNATITMRPIEKKKDGTLIDYGLTVSTRKKPERKLYGLESAGTLQSKKLTTQKALPVAVSVEEVPPKGNRNTRGNPINLRGADRNKRRSSETITTSKGRKSVAIKGTTNKPNESPNSRTSVKVEKKNAKGTGEPQVVGPASQDKKLLYSVWLRRFKDQTGQDPTKDPSSKNS